VIVENDVNLICLGEHKAGRGKGIDDVVCVYVGSGIGAGLILNGRLYAGVDGVAGELGHTVIEPEGRICTCGRRGCLEMYCSGKALALRAESILSRNIYEDSVLAGNRTVQWTDAELVITAGKAGHPAALEELRKAFHYLGLGIANLVSILNPELVILGGGIIENWLEGIDIVRATVRTHAHSVSRDRVTIDRPSLGEKAGFVGASVLVQDWPTRRRTLNQT
jgi:glucokinase